MNRANRYGLISRVFFEVKHTDGQSESNSSDRRDLTVKFRNTPIEPVGISSASAVMSQYKSYNFYGMSPGVLVFLSSFKKFMARERTLKQSKFHIFSKRTLLTHPLDNRH
jgi:hypothetical protein